MTEQGGHQNISKILRVAFFLFAFSFGIGLYALVGAPIRRIDFSPTVTKVGNIIDVANHKLLGLVSSPDDLPNENEIIVNLVDPKTDFFLLKSTLINSKLKKGETRIVVLKNKEKETSIPEFLYYISDIKPSEDLIGTMLGSRYYISYDSEYNGAIVIPVRNADLAFASLIGYESKFVDYTLPLVRPLISNSDIETYKGLKVVTRDVKGVDARVIIGSKNSILYIWGIYKNNIIVAASNNDFSRIIEVLK